MEEEHYTVDDELVDFISRNKDPNKLHLTSNEALLLSQIRVLATIVRGHIKEDHVKENK